MEIAPELADENKEFYLLHKPVCREDVETTKVRVIYVASAKAKKNSPPPSLSQRLLRNRPQAAKSSVAHSCAKPICFCANIYKAFPQIRIRESGRDALHFLWLKDIRKERI